MSHCLMEHMAQSRVLVWGSLMYELKVTQGTTLLPGASKCGGAREAQTRPAPLARGHTSAGF